MDTVRFRAKWDMLLGAKQTLDRTGKISIGDLRVDPLLKTSWNQSTVYSTTVQDWVACYNYYTPPYGAGNVNNYPAGCGNTAVAQILRYFEWPQEGVGSHSFTIWIDEEPVTRSLRGGDGAGGPYDWANMPNVPGGDITLAQAQAIGALMYDCGLAGGAHYAASGSGGGVNTDLFSVFGYSNAVNFGSWDTALVNSNLDAGIPVYVELGGSASVPHAGVCDGYGYDMSTMYHHFNLGWGGASNAWYTPPYSIAGYTVLTNISYNIFIEGDGEIVSGRILDVHGQPVHHATVVATRLNHGETWTATTNDRGIYSLQHLYSTNTYTIHPEKAGMYFSPDKEVSVYISDTFSGTRGNIWGVDFLGSDIDMPAVQFPTASMSGLENAGGVLVEVALSSARSVPISVAYRVSGGSASNGVDYILNDDVLTFLPGEVVKTIPIQVLEDPVQEGPETVLVELSSLDAFCLDKTVLTYTIEDNDLTLAIAVDNDMVSWSTSGSVAWNPQVDFSRDGCDAAMTGPAPQGEGAFIYAYVYGPGQLSFDWYCESSYAQPVVAPRFMDTNYDDGGYIETLELTAVGSWVHSTVNVSSGYHRLTWSLDARYALASTPDRLYLDTVVWNSSQKEQISGTVSCDGVPLEGVEMVGLPGTPVTDAGGAYISEVPYKWTGSVHPRFTGYVFGPVSAEWTLLESNQVQDFTAIRTKGTVAIETSVDDAAWILEDADHQMYSGTGAQTISDLSTGLISVTWLPLAGYMLEDSETTKWLLAEATITFMGSYMRCHHADQNDDGQISLTELLRVIQFFNMRGYHCATAPMSTEDGYLPGAGSEQACIAHDSDYNPQDWKISLTELLRVIQFFNLRGYHACFDEATEDGFCPGR